MNYEEILANAERMKQEYENVEKNSTFKKTCEKIDRLQKRIDTLKAKLPKQETKMYKKLDSMPVSYGDRVLKPIAEEIMRRNPTLTHYEILGGFGLDCEYGLWFFTDDDFKAYNESKHDTSKITYSLTFFDCKNVATGRLIDKYPKGSIGDLNGGNYERVPITSIEQLEQIMFNK